MLTLSKRFLIGLFTLSLFMATSLVAQDTPEAPVISSEIQDPKIDHESLSILMVPLTAAELSELANIWQGNVHEQLDSVARVNLEILGSDNEAAAPLRKQLTDLTTIQSEIQSKYESVISAWKQKGGTAEELLVHENYLLGLRAGTLQTIDPVTLARTAGNWLVSRDGGLGILIKAGTLIIAIWVMSFVAKFIRGFAQRGLEAVPNLSNLLKSFVLTVVYWLSFAVGIVFVLASFGVNVGPLFALFGGLSFILAFALQDTLGNLASGLMIMVLKPFDTDDFIHTAGTSGVVDNMSIISTTIRTFDNQIIVIPNSKIWGDVITNVNASDTRRVDMVFGIAYADNAEHAIKILHKLLDANELVLDDPEAEVFVGELADNSVNIFCRPWVKSEDYWGVYWGMLAEAKVAFDAEGISIPFPQRDVYVHQISSDETA